MKASSLLKGMVPTAFSGGAGAAAYYVHRMLSEKVEFVQKNPYMGPGAMVLLGHVIKTRPSLASVGSALIGAAGYSAAMLYELKKSAAPAVAAPTTQGFDDYDTGALLQSSDIGMLIRANDIGAVEESTASAFQDAYAIGV